MPACRTGRPAYRQAGILVKTQIAPTIHDLRYLKGIGPKRALALEKLGIHSIRDLLYFFPRRYEDRSHFCSIAEARPGQFLALRGEILTLQLKPLKKISILEIVLGDSTGTIHGVWFNRPYLKNQFSVGQELILYGKIELYQGRLQISSPEYEGVEREEEAVHTSRITPVYPLTEGLFQRSLRSSLKEAVEAQVEKNIREYLPADFRAQKNLMELPQAIRQMHFPSSFDHQAAARRRLVFDEFLIFELTLLRKLEKMKTKYKAYRLSDAESWKTGFRKTLPFRLTGDQEKAIQDLAADLEKEVPMNRLLQGDVGCGKTVVAAFALLLAVKNQRQAALLVPTEILAEQHGRTLTHSLRPFGIEPALLTSSTPGPRRQRLLAELSQGRPLALIGTHALLQEDVRFSSLALLIIDEQHKFGVYQRSRLLNSNPRPHQLVMTATPIPRTLALTVYGDLEVTLIEEMPAGRKPIQTFWITRKKQDEVLRHILEQVKKGEQAYFIFPLIEETEKSDLLAAKRQFEHLKKGIFSQIKMGLVHGRLEGEERESIMKKFRAAEIKILVATSVVEVGVDNPNASIMVIENAERFGLAQLHQLRGRIGRGAKASECFLFGEPRTEEGKKRLRILTKTQNGFLIAEEDLKLRGPGDFWGSRQSGEPLFRIANPILDQALLMEARQTAVALSNGNPAPPLDSPEWAGLKNFLEESAVRY